MLEDNLDTSRPSFMLSITSGRSAQSTACSHREDKRVTHAAYKHTNPSSEENSHHTLSSLKEQVKVMEWELAQATKVISEMSHHSSATTRVRDNPNNVTVISGDTTFPVFCTLFSWRYLQERKMLYALLEHSKYQQDNYPYSIANSSPPSSVVTPALRHHTPSIKSLQPSGDKRFAFLPKPDLRSHTVECVPTPARDNPIYDDNNLVQEQPLDDRQHAQYTS
jgi:hypothetical protein